MSRDTRGVAPHLAGATRHAALVAAMSTLARGLALLVLLAAVACGPAAGPGSSAAPAPAPGRPEGGAAAGAAAPLGASPASGQAAAPGAAAGSAPTPGEGAANPYLAAAGEAPVPLKVGVCSITGANLFLYTAVEADLFAKYGLQVEIVRLPGGAASAAALSANEAQLLFCAAENTLGGLATGLDAKLVAAPLVGVPYMLVSRPDVRSIAELRGKTVGVPRLGSAPDLMTRLVLERHGLIPGQDVDLRPLVSGQTEMYQALLGGMIQGTLFGPPLDVQARKDGLHVLYDLSELGLPYLLSALHANSATLQNNPRAVQRFVAATAEAMAFMERNPAVARQALAKVLGSDDPEALDSAYRAYAQRLANRALRVPRDGLASGLEELRAAGTAVSVTSPADLVDDRFVDELDRSGYLTRLWGEQSPR